MIVNTQSIRAKKESLWEVIEESKPDNIAVSEMSIVARLYQRNMMSSGRTAMMDMAEY